MLNASVPTDPMTSLPVSIAPAALWPFPLHTVFPLCLAPNTKDIDIFLRKLESGFGFRVLGGDGADTPVSVSHSFIPSYHNPTGFVTLPHNQLTVRLCENANL